MAGEREAGANHPDALRQRAEHYRRLAARATDPGIRDLYTQMSQLIAERAELAHRRRAFLLDDSLFARK
jgi:hypothetical protein